MTLNDSSSPPFGFGGCRNVGLFVLVDFFTVLMGLEHKQNYYKLQKFEQATKVIR